MRGNVYKKDNGQERDADLEEVPVTSIEHDLDRHIGAVLHARDSNAGKVERNADGTLARSRREVPCKLIRTTAGVVRGEVIE